MGSITPWSTVRPTVERVMSMNGGNGEFSYDRMSVVQASALQILRPVLSEAVKIMRLPMPPSPLRIADFGSATGRNAVAYTDFLVSCIRQEYESGRSLNVIMPEVQAFFNDLPGNDFNTLFRLLDSAETSVHQRRQYFAAGVPGSFYGRLFPKESLHFASCMHCLHWISQRITNGRVVEFARLAIKGGSFVGSGCVNAGMLHAKDFHTRMCELHSFQTVQVPAEVTDPESELYNRGSCWIMGGKPAIARAFAAQSKVDLRKFVQCRATELAHGGILQCFMSGRADLADPTNQTIPERRHRFLAGPDFESAWDTLIAEGIIMEETRDAFNLPIYIPHMDEVRESIEATGSFEIIRLELLEDVALFPDEARLRLIQDPKKCARFYSSWVRALVEPLMVVHMGKECTDEWFVHHERHIYARCQAMQGNSLEQEHYKFLSADFLLLVLKKL